MMLPIRKARQTEKRIVGLQAYLVSENKNLSLHLAFMYARAFPQVFALQRGFILECGLMQHGLVH